jgi:hypothetical protein
MIVPVNRAAPGTLSLVVDNTNPIHNTNDSKPDSCPTLPQGWFQSEVGYVEESQEPRLP